MYGTEQSFLSNSCAGIMTLASYFGIRNLLFNIPANLAMKTSLKYVGFVCVYSQAQDICFQFSRQNYLRSNGNQGLFSLQTNNH